LAERVGDFEWRGEGENAEISLHAPSGADGEALMELLRPAAELADVESPVYAAAVGREIGWALRSAGHLAPDLAGAPERGLLLVAETPVSAFDSPGELRAGILRRLSEMRLPTLSVSGAREICESGATAAAEMGLIEEDDLLFFGHEVGDPDTVTRRAFSASTRDWEDPARFDVFEVKEVFDSERAGELGLEPGFLAFVVRTGAGDLGRLALLAHRQRIGDRIARGEFEVESGPPAAPAETGEAEDLLAAFRAVANFAGGRAALLVYSLRRAVAETAGLLRVRSGWEVGGVEERDGFVHRKELATAGTGSVLVAGDAVAAATGAMIGSAPAFGVPEEDGMWPWEEAGLLERLAGLGTIGDPSWTS
jgi:tRNA-splicing ligase RtcB